MIKKILATILALCIAMSLCACEKDKIETNTDPVVSSDEAVTPPDVTASTQDEPVYTLPPTDLDIEEYVHYYDEEMIATSSTWYSVEIVTNPSEYPQLTKAEFLEITAKAIATGEWDLSHDKIIRFPGGFAMYYYLIDNNWVLDYMPGPNNTECQLTYYEDGVPVEHITEPLLFAEFLDRH